MKFLGVAIFDDCSFTIDAEYLDEFLSPLDQIHNERLKLLHQICSDFDDEQEERLP